MPRDLFATQEAQPAPQARDLFAEDPAVRQAAEQGMRQLAAERQAEQPEKTPLHATMRVTRGMDDDQIIQALGMDPALVKSSSHYNPGDFKAHVSDPNSFAVRNFGKGAGDLLHGLVKGERGLRQAVERIAGIVPSNGKWWGGPSQGDIAYRDAMVRLADADYQTNINPDPGLISKGLDFAGQVMGTPVPGSGTFRGVRTVKGAVKATGKLAALGAAFGAAQPVDVEYNTDGSNDFMKKWATNTAAGAVASPAFTGFGELMLTPVRSMLGKAANAAQKRFASKETQGVMDLAEQFDIPLRAGDVSGNSATRKAENRLLPSSGKMQRFVVDQGLKARGAAQKMGDNLAQQTMDQGFDSLHQVRQIAKGGGPRAAAAQSLLSAAANAGEDWKRILQTSGRVKLFQSKLKADDLYGEVERLSSQFGDVPLAHTVSTLQRLKQEAGEAVMPDAATQRVLEELETGLMRKGQAQATAAGAEVAGGASIPVASSGPDLSYAGIRRLRSDLGDVLADYYTGKNAQVGKKGAQMIAQLQDAVTRDMDAFAQGNGKHLKEAWRAADSYYRTAVVPFKDKALASALSAESPEAVAKMVLSKGDPTAKSRIFKMLDPKGQAAVRQGVVQEAMEKAALPERGSDYNNFSPAKFAKALEDAKATIGAAFQGQAKWEIDGLAKIMRHVDRATEVGADPMNGSRLLSAVEGGKTAGALGSIGALATGHPGVAAAMALPKAASLTRQKALEWLYLSPKGKHFLLAASSLKEGSPAMDKLISKIEASLPRAGAAATKASAPETEPETQE